MTPDRKSIERMQQLDVLIRALRIVAIGLGVLGALWLLGGDRTPDAAPAPVDYSASIVIRKHDTFDFNGIQFYEIAFGNTGQRMTISVDADLAIAEWLGAHTTSRVQLVLRDVNPITRDAEKR